MISARDARVIQAALAYEEAWNEFSRIQEEWVRTRIEKAHAHQELIEAVRSLRASLPRVEEDP